MPTKENIIMASGEKKSIERLISIFRVLVKKRFDKNKYSHRLMLQKIGYITHINDKSLNYNFTWYIRGPYSPDLTKEAYEFREDETCDLSSQDRINAEFIGKCIPEINDKNLELFASVYYLMKERKLIRFDDLFNSLQSSKPWFSEKEIKRTFDKIKDLDLL